MEVQASATLPSTWHICVLTASGLLLKQGGMLVAAVYLQVEFYYITAANQLQRPFVRCIVVGDSNRSVEAAHELGMKSVIVTGNQPAWNFSGADLVVRNLSQLSFVNMKKLFGNEDLVEAQFELEQQPEQLEHL